MMRENTDELLENFANYLNEMAIYHKLFSASTASAFCYMIEDDSRLNKKLNRLVSLVLKIKEEDPNIVNSEFYKAIEKIKDSNLDEKLSLIELSLTFPSLKKSIPSVKNYVQIGRSDKPEHGNDIVFKNDKTLSRVHLVISSEEGQFFIEDRSANGTFVNGTKIEKGIKYPVCLDDEIRIGRGGTLITLGEEQIQKLLSA